MAYCTSTDVYNITNLDTGDISAALVDTIIEEATAELNADIGITRYEDFDLATVGSIDSSNTQFHFKLCPIGDLDNDGTVNTSDISLWYKNPEDDHWTAISDPVASIDDAETGLFTLNTAPSPEKDYLIKYRIFPIPSNDRRIKKACMELSSYMCFLKLNLKDTQSYKIGKVSVSKTPRQPRLENFYERYKKTLQAIRGRTIFRTTSWDMTNKIARDLSNDSTGAGIPNIPVADFKRTR